jgi:hypothetical protein
VAEEAAQETVRAGLSEEEMRDNIVRLAFGGDRGRFEAFCEAIRTGIPDNTGAVMRGSSITGKRWEDGAPFDADGPGTSDLDLTLVGGDVVGFYNPLTGFYIPGVHSKPISEKDPDIAPDLLPLRRRLMEMVKRPVNIQASRELVLQFRGGLLDQPFLTLIDKTGE